MSKLVIKGPEYTDVQRPAWELLRDKLGYEYAHGLSEEFAAERESESEVLLVGRLSRKLKEINDGLSDSGVRQAIDALRLPVAMSLLEANEKLHSLLTRWVNVEERADNQSVGRSVKFFDFDEPNNNEFLVVEELPIKGPRMSRRLDLAIFVNGIPLAAIECKAPTDQHGIEHAISDLLVYQDRDKGVTRLFHTVQLCMATKGRDARFGTVETPMSWYVPWKSCYPLAKEQLAEKIGWEPTEQDQMLAGLLSKQNLLDMARNFVVFDREGGKIVKKVARYQQFEAVNRSIDRITDPKSKVPVKDRGGVVWHTQGSGKSLTMLWLAVKLRRLRMAQNPTLLVVSDRKSLDRQITKKFQNCGFENPARAERIKHLRKLLGGPQGQTIMTTVHKFFDKGITVGRRVSTHPELSLAENIFVLIDEAHRTEYGWLNAHMRRALPNACLLAFTGTPIPDMERPLSNPNINFFSHFYNSTLRCGLLRR